MQQASQRQLFYYRFKTNYVWLGLTILLFVAMIYCVWCCPVMIYWWQVWALFGTCFYSFALWAIKYLCKHIMVAIDDKYIKIDHCKPLPWRMVAFAEFKTARCCWLKLPIIAIRTKKPIRYKFNLMQKWCAKSDFTPFSIALYALSPEDANRIASIIAQRTALLG